jgi:hypothetical protein
MPVRRAPVAVAAWATAVSSPAFASAPEAVTFAEREVTCCIVYKGVPFLDCITIVYPDEPIIVA